MNKNHIDKFIKDMELFLPTGSDYHARAASERDDSVELIVADIKKYSVEYDQIVAFGKRYIEAWDLVIYARLKAMVKAFDTGKRVAVDETDASKGKVTFDDLLQRWGRNVSSRTDIGLIRFGQKRVASTFAESRTGDQNQTLGVPLINGRPLRVVASEFQERGLGIDRNPLKIFYHEPHNCWVAANNRSYAAHCMAGTRPLRLWPGEADDGERRRLTETLTSGDVKLTAGVRVTLPRSLPSLEMPITNGQQDLMVTDVVTVPPTFYLDWSR
ncbi:hypothetical protein ACVWWJ_001976 [Luteibacter sp. HA06]|jgi:hypothetical protein